MSYPQTMNREVFQEGWLIKSPPTKRIWRARWRRRWFTLKQGEIPGQYCLEYYTDRSCRKLKGIIDLDQCEQVDCGLRLEYRKQKFQYMFDVKTPRRTFYLAAESEVDMHDWVNCICQVCNLQDLTKQQVCDRQYYNMGNEALAHKPDDDAAAVPHHLNNNHCDDLEPPTSASSQAPLIPLSPHFDSNAGAYQNDEFFAVRRSLVPKTAPNSDYTNRDTIVCGDSAASTAGETAAASFEGRTDYYNFMAGDRPDLERSQSVSVHNGNVGAPMATRPLSLAEPPMRLPPVAPPRTSTRKIPDQLKLTDTILSATAVDDLSPALSTASGPYIAISECFTGTGSFPVLPLSSVPGAPKPHDDATGNDPTTPLNSLDPRFYDMPRSRQTIGLNLIDEPQPYSPKRSNVTGTPVKGGISGLAAAVAAPSRTPSKSGRSSPSDSESVFTDDDEWPSTGAVVAATGGGAGEQSAASEVTRSMRPSDSSVENDSMAYTYTQRFSKMPAGGNAMCDSAAAGPAIDGRRLSIVAAVKGVVEPWIEASAFGSAEALENDDECDDSQSSVDRSGGVSLSSQQQQQMSDTENASPAIGPKDMNSCVDENYDIPRSYQQPYNRLAAMPHSPGASTPSTIMTTSTPNLAAESAVSGSSAASTVGARPARHFYTNAAPSRMEGNVFRYDFVEQENAPLVNRGLKPKPSAATSEADALRPASATPLKSVSARRNVNPPPAPLSASATAAAAAPQSVPAKSATVQPPPSIDRKLKPTALEGFATYASAAVGSPAAPSYASQTLPRNYNHSTDAPARSFAGGHMRSNSTVLTSTVAAAQPAAPAAALPPMLDYLELDTSNSAHGKSASLDQSKGARPKINASVSLSSMQSDALGASATSAAERSTVYKVVDFVKTEAIKRTRQDRVQKTTTNGTTE